MCVNKLWWVVSARHLYRVTVKLDRVAQLCVFILGMQYLNLGVLKRVFGYGTRHRVTMPPKVSSKGARKAASKAMAARSGDKKRKRRRRVCGTVRLP